MRQRAPVTVGDAFYKRNLNRTWSEVLPNFAGSCLVTNRKHGRFPRLYQSQPITNLHKLNKNNYIQVVCHKGEMTWSEDMV